MLDHHRHVSDTARVLSPSSEASCPANTTCRRLQAASNVLQVASSETPRRLRLGRYRNPEAQWPSGCQLNCFPNLFVAQWVQFAFFNFVFGGRVTPWDAWWVASRFQLFFGEGFPLNSTNQKRRRFCFSPWPVLHLRDGPEHMDQPSLRITELSSTLFWFSGKNCQCSLFSDFPRP